jgi:NADH-quinone oxidoreductase subunit E
LSRAFSLELKQKIDETLARYPEKRAALIPVLHLVQNETGFISAEDERTVAALLDIKPIMVREVVTFYTMFNRKSPGRFHIRVCTNLSCSLAGGEKVVDYLKTRLGVQLGQTTPDGKFTLTEVECLGGCDQSPCLMVNFDHFENLDRDKIERLLESLK